MARSRFAMTTLLSVALWTASATADPFRPVTNADAAETEVSRLVGRVGPGHVTVVYVSPSVDGPQKRSTNPFGHVTIAYQLPNGQHKVVNVQSAGPIINMVDYKSYIFGGGDPGASQQKGGAMNRNITVATLTNVSPEKMRRLHAALSDLKERSDAGKLVYEIVTPYAKNFASRVLPGEHREVGNCALWTSKALVAAGLLAKPTMLPKKLFAQFLEQHHGATPEHLRIVHYEQREDGNHGQVTRGINGPWTPRMNAVYRDLKKFADVTVTPDRGKSTVTVRSNSDPARPDPRAALLGRGRLR
jgi:hypothetical protein